MPVLGGGVAALNGRGTWTASAAYTVGDVVSWQGTVWSCKTGHTSSADFDTTKFVAVGLKPLGAIGSIHGQFLFYGNSYVATSQGYPMKIYPRLLIEGTGDPSSLLRGLSGATMAEVAWNIAKLASVDQGVVLIDGVINDVTGTDAKRIASFTNGLRASLDFALAGLAGNRILHTDAGMAFTGTWSTVTMAGNLNSRTYRRTVTQNDSFTVTFTGDKVTLMLLGVDDAATTPLGGAFSVKQGATVLATGNLSNQARLSGSAALGTDPAVAHFPVRLSGFGAGSHTVTVTKTDASGTALGIDCAVMALTWPPQVVVIKGITPATDGIGGARGAYLSTYNGIIDTEGASSFLPTGAVTVIDPAAGNSWSPNVFTEGSGLHLSSAGHDVFAGAIVERLTNLPYRPGLTNPSFLDWNPGANP